MTQMKEWTLMFYFASDNPLAPGVVSQLKAIKEAGYHPDVSVITQFDPQTVGTPTHIFDVNIIEKLKHRNDADIGFGDSVSPFVRNLVEDKLWRNQRTRDEVTTVRDKIKYLLKCCHGIEDYDPPVPPKPGSGPGDFRMRRRLREPGPKESLHSFMDFCRQNYPAKHYMLFILGHGVVVGNDIFLFDENADVQSLTLTELGEVIDEFAKGVEPRGSKLELISFHSCSVSALEVAYELKNNATYMLASQGPAFVGSWPYRQILIRIFKSLRRVSGGTTDGSIERLAIGIFYSCLYNSTDFLLAGYSFDLSLCRLKLAPPIDRRECPTVRDKGEPLVAVRIRSLAKALSDALWDPCEKPRPAGDKWGPDCDPVEEKKKPLGDPIKETDLVARDLIQLAHLQSQSYWQENYTDLFDFCFCFSRLFKQYEERYRGTLPKDQWKKLFGKSEAIYRACCCVMKALEPEGPLGDEDDGYNTGVDRQYVHAKRSDKEEKLIVRTAFAGPSNQYSHGLSVYFPWTEPSADNPILEEYPGYEFAKQTSWHRFLKLYFKKTVRNTRKAEEADQKRRPICKDVPGCELRAAEKYRGETTTEKKEEKS